MFYVGRPLQRRWAHRWRKSHPLVGRKHRISLAYLNQCSLLWRHNGRDGVSNTSLTIVYSTVHSGADQRNHQSSASLAFVREIHQWPGNSPHKWPVMRKMFPFNDVIMLSVCDCVLAPMINMCLLQDVVMEAAFPQSAICRLANHVVKENAELLASLESGEAYRKEGIFISGSRVEGLAMEDYWGHQSPDEDVMVLYGGRRAVFVPGGNRERGESCLIYRPEGCPSAYTNLEISDLMSLRNEWWWKEKCLHEDGDRQWLNTFNTVRCFKRGDPDDERITTGPSNESWGGARDIVATFVCSSPHPELVQDFKNKRLEGSWPPPHLIDYLLELPMLLVLVGHKPSDECPLQARLSWSVPEIKLFQELSENIRQGYIACKYVLKYRLKIYRLQKGASDGRSTVGSYHLKTAFLHFLEKRPPSLINSPFKLFLGILRELDMHLQAGRLPHYFLQRCDLLETVGDDERRIARQAIKDVLSDPLTALFTSAVLPWQMYGQVHPHDLIFHFRSVCTQPTGGRSWKELCYLLTRVDEWRHRRYNKQLE